MTISSSNRKAGPFTGNDVTVAFPFTFKVFAATDVLVVKALISTGVETVQTLTTDYTVSLNADQNATPGGTITLPAALPTGYTLTATSQVANLQPTNLTNAGGFYPTVINDALDRTAIQIQQLAESQSRAVTASLSSSATTLTLPAPVPSTGLGWDVTGTTLVNVEYTDLPNSQQATAAALVATTQAGISTTQAGLATAAKTAAEAARDAAIIGSGSYATEADGRAAVADGAAFKVQGSGDVAAYEYRRINSTTSVLIATYPSLTAVTAQYDNVSALIQPIDQGMWLSPSSVTDAKLGFVRNYLGTAGSQDVSSWSRQNILSVTAGSIAFPGEGTVPAYTVIPSTANNYHTVNTAMGSVAGTATHSMYVKAAGNTKVALMESGTTSDWASFDLATGATFGKSAGTLWSSIEAVGSGIYRISATFQSANHGCQLWVLWPSYTSGASPAGTFWAGNGTDGVIALKPQVEKGLRATTPQHYTYPWHVTFADEYPLTEVYTTSLGTKPVDLNDDPIGLVLDRNRAATYMPELVSNPGMPFIATTGWTAINATIFHHDQGVHSIQL